MTNAGHIDRFRRDLDALVKPEATIGLAVSGGPDSLALLLLAAEARPLRVEAATVDHALRPESRAEAEMVAGVCEQAGIPHSILTAKWEQKPESAIQEQARMMRYRLLGQWTDERGLAALVTAHHLDDQAETFLMRLSRGSGVRGLSAMRPVGWSPAGEIPLLRPLLAWTHSELESVSSAAGIKPVQDPSNADERFERVRVRKALSEADWLDAAAIARSAAHLTEADVALQWAAELESERSLSRSGDQIAYKPGNAPREIRRRIVGRCIAALASEGAGAEPRGREMDQLLAILASGRQATLRGVLCVGGPEWLFTRAPARR